MSLLYSKAAEIIKQVCEEGKGFRDVFYSTETSNAKAKLYGLISKTLALRQKLEEALKEVLPEEKFANHYFTLAMLCDLVNGREISGGGKVKRLLEKNKSKFRALLKPVLKKERRATKAAGEGPKRYLRVTCDIKQIEEIIRSGLSAESNEEGAESLVEPMFQPTEFGELFEFTDNSLVGRILKNSQLRESIFSSLAYLQDKSTCLTAHALLPSPLPSTPVHVLDVCAAPGSKSLHLLSLLRPGDSLTMVERDPKRAETLKTRLKAATGWSGETEVVLGAGEEQTSLIGKGVRIRLIVADFMTISSPGATHISLDPSCSGSGLDTHETTAPSADLAKRLFVLSDLQRRMLRHATDVRHFPKAQVICYSTCSSHRDENEDVVSSVVGVAAGKNFKISDEYPKQLVSSFKDGTALKTSAAKHNCRGFFLQKLVRVPQAKRAITLAKAPARKIRKLQDD